MSGLCCVDEGWWVCGDVASSWLSRLELSEYNKTSDEELKTGDVASSDEHSDDDSTNADFDDVDI